MQSVWWCSPYSILHSPKANFEWTTATRATLRYLQICMYSLEYICTLDNERVANRSSYSQMSPTHFCASCYRFRDLTISDLWSSESTTRSRSKFSQLHHSMPIVKIYIMSPIHFFWANSYRFRDIKMLTCLHSKSSSRLRSVLFLITIFDDKCQNLQITPTRDSHTLCASSYL